MNIFDVIANGDLEAVKSYIANGGDLNAKNEFGWTILMSASGSQYKDITELLINAGADLNLQDKDGFTALICSCCFGELENVKLLIKAGAKLDIQDNEGNTALMWAVTTYAWWYKSHRRIAVEALIKAGAKLDIQDNEGFTALMWAKYENYKSIVKLLINAGAKK